MTSWDDLRERARKNQRDDPTSISTTRQLIQIYDQAEAWGIDPTVLQKANKTNLRDIIRPAKEVIAAGDRDKLESLLGLASSLTNKELRAVVREPAWEYIRVRTDGHEPPTKYYL